MSPANCIALAVAFLSWESCWGWRPAEEGELLSFSPCTDEGAGEGGLVA